MPDPVTLLAGVITAALIVYALTGGSLTAMRLLSVALGAGVVALAYVVGRAVFGRVAPALADFLTAYPRLKMELTITDRLIDLAEEGYDMAIRVTADPPLTPMARKLAPVRRNLCGTPAYFEKSACRSSPPIWCITTA